MGREGYISAAAVVFGAVTAAFLIAILFFILGFFGVPLGQPDAGLFSIKSACGAYVSPYQYVVLPALIFAVLAAFFDTVNALWGWLFRIKDSDGWPVSWPGRTAIVLAFVGFVILYWAVFPFAGWLSFSITILFLIIPIAMGWLTSF